MRNTSKPFVSGWPTLAASAALLALGCGGGSTHSSTSPTPNPGPGGGTGGPSLQISSPAASATNASPDLDVTVQTTGFQLVNNPGQPNASGQGHLNFWMDADPAGNPNMPGAKQAFATNFQVGGVVTPGNHTLFVELRNNDGTPLNPRVIRQVTVATPTIHFSQDVLRVFTNNGAKTCAQAGCHNSSSPQAGQNLEAASAYANIVNVASTEKPSLKRVQPGDGDNSYLYLKIKGDPSITGSRMPLAGGPLADSDIDKIELWIDQGAVNN
jgi:archaellum component FlaG (FlaF/FlaG flagellin family)